MHRRRSTIVLLIALCVAGCHLHKTGVERRQEARIETIAQQVDCGGEDEVVLAAHHALENAPTYPLVNGQPREPWDLSLVEALQIALQHSQVLRDLGGRVLPASENVQTVFDPAIRASDPRFGVEAALSDFDAVLTSNFQAAKNDRAFNNQFFGGGTRILEQDVLGLQTDLSKRSATGTVFSARHNTDYDASNAPGNRFPSAWNTNFEVQARQPLLQGKGILFNRIAGTGTPGAFNGVLIAKINTDIDLAEFEVGLRDFVSNVENAYWDLYYAYRNLDSRIVARNASLDTWRKVHALYEAGRRGGEAEKEAQALGQYHRFQLEVDNALYGEPVEGTRTRNGIEGGAFRGVAGVHTAEQRLRLMIGLPSHDGQLIRPSDEPVLAEVLFDPPSAMEEALTRRVELRQQQMRVQRREMELFASQAFLRPKLDAVGLYRWRGFGQGLIRDNDIPFDNAYQNLTTGDFQEWQLGLELDVPLGMRRAHAAVRHAELRLSRAQAILREQQRDAVSGVYQALLQLERAYKVAESSYNVRHAADQELHAVQAAYDAGTAPLDQVLDAQRRMAESQSRFHRATVEYAQAIKNVHFSKGSYFEYHQLMVPSDLDVRRLDATSQFVDLPELEPSAMNYVMDSVPPRQAPPLPTPSDHDRAVAETTESAIADDPNAGGADITRD